MQILPYLKPNVIVTTIIQLSLPLAIYLGIISNSEWYWWAICIFFFTVVYSLIGHNIGYHRYFTHKHFKINSFVEYLFLWAGSSTGLGDPVAYAATHMTHHKYPDTPLDPHGPARGVRSIIYFFHKRINFKDTPIRERRLFELNKKYHWVHNYYNPLLLANIVLLYLISYKVFLFCWFIPVSLFLWGISAAVLFQHWGFKARNYWVDKWVPWQEGLHLNHHLYPAAPNCAVNPHEIDYTYQVSRLFTSEYDWRGQPKTK